MTACTCSTGNRKRCSRTTRADTSKYRAGSCGSAAARFCCFQEEFSASGCSSAAQGKRTSVKIVTFEAALGAKEGVIRGKLPPDCNPQRVARARKTGQWPVFTEQRAGRPWTMYVARSISAEQSMPCGSKNAFLTDLPPGSPEGARGKSAQGVALAGEGFPRQHGSRIHA